MPLSDWAVDEFRALFREAERSPFVLPSAKGHSFVDPKLLTRSLAKCRKRMKRLGIAHFVLHNLRRTCRAGLARLRIQPHIAERVLNHAQERIAGTYDVHDYLEEKREALQRWATYLESMGTQG